MTLDDGGNPSGRVGVDLARVDKRVLALARAQSDDIATKLAREGVRVVRGVGRLDGPSRIVATTDTGEETVEVDAVLVVDRCPAAGTPRRGAGRRAHPDLGAGLRARRSCPSTSSWSAPA